jgi:alpha-beta hydrolase superfamily lysophospholipase
MKKIVLWVLAFLPCGKLPLAKTPELPPNEQVVFTAKDGVQVFGNLFPAEGGNSQPLILLFHQAASNGLAEYQNIIPQLLGMGYHLLVVDLREGSGETYGGENRTAKAWKSASPDAYCAAFADVEAALAFAETRGFSGKKILWGSGYSAALVIQLAVNQPDKMDGVLAFAPAQGGSVTPCEPTEALLSKLKKPLIVFRCEEELKQPNRQQQAEMFRKMGIPFVVATGMRHGASVLDATRNDGSVEAAWDEVRRFLRGIGD